LKQIPTKFYPRIILHDAYDLRYKYAVGGLHFSTKKRALATEISIQGTKSTSCHSIAELQNIDGQFDYAFLSPIFPSISKQGYEGNLDMQAVQLYLQEQRTTKAIALGGIDNGKIAQIKEWGFDGYAKLGDVWKIKNTGGQTSNKLISRIQYITQDNAQLTHAQQAKLMFENGVDWVQIRMKNCSKEAIIVQAKEALFYARALGGKLIINDHIDICKELGADGVHVGLSDTDVAETRAYLGNNFIIGGTANTIEDIQLHLKNGADYIGLGPFRFTTTKKNLSPIIGLDGYKQLVAEMQKRNIQIPVVAVGGIMMTDIEDIQSVGLYGVAISTALLNEKLKGKMSL
jgi:thiamine-phosphate pyrophosphorylase